MNRREALAALTLLQYLDRSHVVDLDDLIDHVRVLHAAAAPTGTRLDELTLIDTLNHIGSWCGSWCDDDVFYHDAPTRPHEDVQVRGDVL